MSDVDTTARPGTLSATTNGLIALANIQELLMLDDLWTRYLKASAQELLVAEQPDYEGLRELAFQINEGLRRSSDVVHQVHVMLDNMDDGEVSRQLARIREVEPRAAGVIDWLLEDEPGADSARAVLISACRYIEEQVWDELDHLSGKVQQLDADKLPDPDLRLPFKCALTIVGIGATAVVAAVSVASVVGTIPAAGLAVAMGAGGLAQVWTTSDCPDRWRPRRPVPAG